jgi:hypothetical protein
VAGGGYDSGTAGVLKKGIRTADWSHWDKAVPPYNTTLLNYSFIMEIAMTPSIVKNVVRMPKRRAKQVRARISYMSSEQLERFLLGCPDSSKTPH